MAKYKQHKHDIRLELQRNLEFTLYNTTFAGMSGVKVFKSMKKPQDLYPLSSDNKNYKPIKIDKVEQAKAIEKVKQNKNFIQWQQKS